MYKVAAAYQDAVIAQGKGSMIMTEKISAGQLARGHKVSAWSDSESEDKAKGELSTSEILKRRL